jgi:hypothetical protein
MESSATPRLILLLSAIALLLGLTAREAFAHFTTAVNPLYAARICSTALADRRDPVNTVFTQSATASASKNHVAFHTGWTTPAISLLRYFWSHGSCGPSAWRLGNLVAVKKFLVDARQTADADVILGKTTVATPRRVKKVACAWIPYSLDAFDQGREQLWIRMSSGGHKLKKVYNGNSQSFQQCDGSKPASDGLVYFIIIPSVLHP